MLVFILSVFCITINCMANETLTKSQINPHKIKKTIERQGLEQTIKSLYDDQKTWDTVLKSIASGKQEWLIIAKLLKSGADAGPSEMLNLAMGEALANAPKRVLEIMEKDNVFTPIFVCNGPDIDNAKFSTYDKAIKETNYRIAVLEKVNDTNLKDIRNVCIDKLRESIPHLQNYFHK